MGSIYWRVKSSNRHGCSDSIHTFLIAAMTDLTNTDDPRDILLFLDGTCCFREQCDPELLRGGEYRVIKHYSFEWYARERGIPD